MSALAGDLVATRQIQAYRVAAVATVPAVSIMLVIALVSSEPVPTGRLLTVVAIASAVVSPVAVRSVRLARIVTPFALAIGAVGAWLASSMLPPSLREVALPIYGMLAVGLPFLVDGPAVYVLHGCALASLSALLVGYGTGPVGMAAQLLLYVLLALLVTRLSASQNRALQAQDVASRDARNAADLIVHASLFHAVDPGEVISRLVAAAESLGFGEVGVVRRTGDDLTTIEGKMDPSRLFAAVRAAAATAPETAAEPDLAGSLRVVSVAGRDVVCMPLRRYGIAVGTVVALAPAGQRVTSQQVATLQSLVNLAAQSIDLAHRLDDQQRTIRHLTELDRQKNDFVSNVSHELRTPLTVVKGLGQTLAMRRIDLRRPPGSELLARLSENAERLGRMVESLLDMSRIHENDPTPVLEQVDLGALARSVVRRLETLSTDHPVEVAAETGEVLADPTLIEHVLENLISNAVKHTEPGTTVRVRVSRLPDRVRVVVADDGPGIPPDELPRLTEQFFRGGAPTRRTTSGLGLGLALVDRILSVHGSALEIASDLGHGSAFSFSLPLLEG